MTLQAQVLFEDRYSLDGFHTCSLAFMASSSDGCYQRNAFLHDTLSEPVYCEQQSNFVDLAHMNYACSLHKAFTLWT